MKRSRYSAIRKSRRIAWMGHLMRMENDRISKRIMIWNPGGRRSKGRHRRRWRDSVEDNLKLCTRMEEINRK
ncbi:hypothetical protein C0J52_20775 [Blattella germanica]|nr:hypothetical protein C0J52_20775 [Blattella germanica]